MLSNKRNLQTCFEVPTREQEHFFKKNSIEVHFTLNKMHSFKAYQFNGFRHMYRPSHQHHQHAERFHYLPERAFVPLQTTPPQPLPKGPLICSLTIR